MKGLRAFFVITTWKQFNWMQIIVPLLRLAVHDGMPCWSQFSEIAFWKRNLNIWHLDFCRLFCKLRKCRTLRPHKKWYWMTLAGKLLWNLNIQISNCARYLIYIPTSWMNFDCFGLEHLSHLIMILKTAWISALGSPRYIYGIYVDVQSNFSSELGQLFNRIY